jgi:hypothetical protein
MALRHTGNIGSIGTRITFARMPPAADHIDLNHLRPGSIQITAADAAPQEDE